MAELEAKASAPPKQIGPQDLFAGPDIMAAAASGGIAAPLSGLAGVAGTLLPGPEGQGARFANKVNNALTYKPRTSIGEMAMGAISKPFEALHAGAVMAGETAQDKLGFEPAGATAVQTAIETLPSLALMSRSQPKQTPETAARQSLNEVQDATFNAARAEGYKFPPSSAGGGGVNKWAEGAAGRPMLNQEITLHNQKITNKIAAREAGLPENSAITVGRLEARRQQLAAPYREVAQIDPLVAQDLQALREARADAKKWFSYYDRTGNPVVEKRAQRLANQAEFLESQIEQAAVQAGKPDLVNRLKKARQEIAKTYDIERALIEGSGDISAASLGAMLDKGKPLSGGLETIAMAQQSRLKPYMGDAGAIRNPGVERIRGALGVAANLSGAHGGIGWLSEGLPMLAGPTRSMIMSEPYQNLVGRPSYPASQMTPQTLAGILASKQRSENK